MKVSPSVQLLLGTIMAAAFSHAGAAAFVSGSTGADGALAPTADTTIQLPASGVLHYTTVNIPSGVTVRFAKNSANTAVVMLTTGDVKIDGTIEISGSPSQTTKYGVAGDINKGGAGGPGGFDGGRGGLQEQNRRGGTGYGPGGGGGGIHVTTYDLANCYAYVQGGGGGGFAGAGEGSKCIQGNNNTYDSTRRTGFAGPSYGSNSMLPLVGGSGGGGGAGGPNGWSLPGAGGGGGGGALMLVAAGSVTLSGKINSKGGNGGNINNGDCYYDYKDSGGPGGGGAGGAVRILTPSFTSTGSINVGGGVGGCRTGSGATNAGNDYNSAGNGGVGRSSVEIVSGGTFSLSVIPTLAITSIGGVAVPANPTGAGDVTLPGDLANPASVTISASGIPVGTAVKLTLSQPYDVNVIADASALAGSLQTSTSTGTINIPSGASVLMASTTYALTMAQGEALSVYAQGERVEKVSLAAALGGGEQKVTLITVSGKEYEVPAAVLAMMPS